MLANYITVSYNGFLYIALHYHPPPMSILFPLLLFAIGLVLLVKGADYLVDGASSLAKRFNVPELAIGLTIVAFGTSAPELLVSLEAACTAGADVPAPSTP